ncbi:MAG: hypothetical protein DRQ62_10890 [Gammaproteobacteria bacterium]|nr:MAG: hypothetical protein DRQ62_10890 [Gammaproteobacteria bacterium]
MKYKRYLALFTIILTGHCFAGTTTTSNPESGMTVVEQPAAPPVKSAPKLIGPTGVTGTIRRSDRRQDRRLEEDLEDLGDAIDRRPSIDNNSIKRSNRRR